MKLHRVEFPGTTFAPNTVSTRGSIVAYGSFLTNVEAWKRVIIDETGLSFRPATANCTTSIQVKDINANRRIVERIAWRRSGRMQPDMEAQTSRSAERPR